MKTLEELKSKAPPVFNILHPISKAWLAYCEKLYKALEERDGEIEEMKGIVLATSGQKCKARLYEALKRVKRYVGISKSYVEQLDNYKSQLQQKERTIKDRDREIVYLSALLHQANEDLGEAKKEIEEAGKMYAKYLELKHSQKGLVELLKDCERHVRTSPKKEMSLLERIQETLTKKE